MQTALITGSSRGIGRACARSLKDAGYDVVVHCRERAAEAEALARELNGRWVQADVADDSAVQAMFESIGGVDVLVCSAGVALLRQFQDTTAADWQRIMAVNLGGAVSCIRAALPHMLHNKFGRIVTVSSMWGVTGASCESAYAASKAALIGLTRSLAKELGPSGITVNCVAPGVIDTDMNASLTERDLDQLREETPLGVLGTPQDVAEAVRYLVSAPFVTGQVLGVNGGILI
ncbi:MAG: 3-oxoacyl-ACP reductase FabG [Oscillospiraceae bacterium]|nr:3-oxoacyl-ACP reductase FabG [Oscillospiraceae bacterium]